MPFQSAIYLIITKASISFHVIDEAPKNDCSTKTLPHIDLKSTHSEIKT
jgi:hypothetical protein